ncbi:MAG: hypothetical protein OXG55_02300 [bacterium]|nr:hypothetical protein [bacterium]
MINEEPALEALHEFRGHLQRNEDIHRRGGSKAASADESADRLAELEPLIEQIAAEVESDPKRHTPPSHGAFVSGTWSWSNRVRWVVRLIGILENRARHADIFAPPGPKLAASQLHPWVWNAATDLWDNGHYREAVQKAATAVEQQTQLKLDLTSRGGTDLYMTAFKADAKSGDRRVRFGHLQQKAADGELTADWRSAHDGAAHFGRRSSVSRLGRVPPPPRSRLRRSSP